MEMSSAAPRIDTSPTRGIVKMQGEKLIISPQDWGNFVSPLVRFLSINWCINCVLMRVMDAMKETIADVSSMGPSSERMTRNVSCRLFHGIPYPHQHTVDTPVYLPPCRHSYLVPLFVGVIL